MTSINPIAQMDESQPRPHPHHRRAKSSVLANLSFIHKRTPSAGATLSDKLPSEFVAYPNFEIMPHFPSYHPHTRALGELHQNQQSQTPKLPLLSSPKKSREQQRRLETLEAGSKTLHKKTLSSLSLKSLAKRDTNANANRQTNQVNEVKARKPRKIKSSTNIAGLLSRSRLSKPQPKDTDTPPDQENANPVLDAEAGSTRPPPIYAQFASEQWVPRAWSSRSLEVEDEINRYTPKEDVSGKRDFYLHMGRQPTLRQRDEVPLRPRSTYLPSRFSIQDIGRRVSGGSRHSAELIRRVSGKHPHGERRTSAASNPPEKERSEKIEKTGKTIVPNRGQRMLAAVSTSFGSGASTSREGDRSHLFDDKDIDTEFEAMLDRRNIPEHQRGKMRNLAISVKRDFVKQDWAETAAAAASAGNHDAERPGTHGSDHSSVSVTDPKPKTKSKRPRSRTFTLSRTSGGVQSKEAATPSKKSKGDKDTAPSRESLGGGVGALFFTAAAQTMVAKAKGQCPDDFVAYLRRECRPETVEVGRLHKLRLLLRNETVAWTEDFIHQGGMGEIVGLLHRVMEIEWREEHEDSLLHEVLLCLKALSTTALALRHLHTMQTSLFPALLHMLFDEEKKGPSEFTTRNIITSLLFTYLKAAPLAERSLRAQTLLSYLRDPEPSEAQRPVGFVLEMHRPRPYRVWCKEVVNVTKEVFWIFLHHLNVIALPGGGDPASPSAHDYAATHFPLERPPVAAAPYVGGVEWDATNYLASHLDLVNGILASLPAAERNELREAMRLSGWEKCMGGTLRLCKEKFYGSVHAGLRCWVAAAVHDEWDTKDVRCGPVEPKKSRSKSKSKQDSDTHVHNKAQPQPLLPSPKIALDLPRLQSSAQVSDVWL